MKLLANENFPRASVLFLRNAGYDISAVGENLWGISDKYVMELAIAEGRTIITFDRDYGELIYKYGYKPSQGVIYLRLGEFSPEQPGAIIDDLIKNMRIQTTSMFTVYDGTTLRQRRY